MSKDNSFRCLILLLILLVSGAAVNGITISKSSKYHTELYDYDWKSMNIYWQKLHEVSRIISDGATRDIRVSMLEHLSKKSSDDGKVSRTKRSGETDGHKQSNTEDEPTLINDKMTTMMDDLANSFSEISIKDPSAGEVNDIVIDAIDGTSNTGELKKQLSRLSQTSDSFDVEDLTKRLQSLSLSSSNFEDQYVISLEPDDRTVEDAAMRLRSKAPYKTTLVRFNKETGNLEYVLGPKIQLSEKSRVQVVGHGRVNSDAEKTIGHLTGKEVAYLIEKIPRKSEILGKVSLIGCNMAEAPTRAEEFFNQPFMKDMLVELRSANIETRASGRTVPITINKFGQKIYQVLTPDGIKDMYLNEQEITKVEAHLTPDGEIRTEVYSHIDKPSQLNHRRHKFGESTILVDTEEIVMAIESMKSGKIVEQFIIDKTDMDNYLNEITEKTFLAKGENKEDINLKEKMVWEEIEKTKFLQNLNEQYPEMKLAPESIISLDINGHEVTAKIEYTLPGNKKKTYKELDVSIGSKVEEKYVYRWENKLERDIKNVREINSMEDMIRDIKWMGLTGHQNTGIKEYYRFQDVVLSFDPNSFYFEFHGSIASEENPSTTMWENVPVGERKEWIFGDKAPPKYIKELAQYNDIYKGLEMKEFGYVMEKWMYGTGEEFTRAIGKKGISNTARVQMAMGGHALFMAEPIRNFRTFAINGMGLELCKEGTITFDTFTKLHPMGRGGSALTGKLETGFNGIGTKNEHVVKPKELALTREWLLNHERPLERKGKTFKMIAGEKDDFRFVNKKSLHNEQRNKALLYFGDQDFTKRNEDYTLSDFNKESAKLNDVVAKTPEAFKEMVKLDMMTKNLEMTTAMAEDHTYINKALAKKLDKFLTEHEGTSYKVVEDSVHYADGEIKFSVINEANFEPQSIELSASIDEEKLSSKKLVSETTENIKTWRDTKWGSAMEQTNKGLAIYGIAMGIKGAIANFENGNVIDGSVNLAMATHGLAEMTGAMAKLKTVGGKALGRVLNPLANSIKTFVLEVPSLEGASKVLSGIGKIGELMEDIPIIGSAFGVYMVVQDFKQHSTLGYIDGALDILITATGLLGPEFEPVVIALTIIRMGIDDFYNDISAELKALPANASGWDKVGAVFKGIGNAIRDLFYQWNVIGQIINAVGQSRKIDEQYDKDRKTLSQLADFSNYFNVETENGSDAKVINFADGKDSWNGGSIVFRLGEDGKADLKMEEAMDEDGNIRAASHTIDVGTAQDIMMGIGESNSVQFKKVSANILWFIPVDTKYLISKWCHLKNSLHGTYYGNSKDNKFFSVSSLGDSASKLDYTLQQYSYELFGEGGNDVFFLGPQKSLVHGGEGSDSYIVPKTGGQTEIDNYAINGDIDMLFIEDDFQNITAERSYDDLYLYDGEHEQRIIVKRWYHGPRYQHMIFKACKGVIFHIGEKGNGITYVYASTIDKSGADKGVRIDVSKFPWYTVVNIIGSDYNDYIIGNDEKNQIRAGKGSNRVVGGKGIDTYILDIAEGTTQTINNCADDLVSDMAMLTYDFLDIEYKNSGNDLLMTSKRSKNSAVRVWFWFSEERCRHLIFWANDGVIFNVSSSPNHRPFATALMINMENKKSGQTIDLNKDIRFENVSAIIGSPYADNINGNNADNYIKGGRGNDFIRGGEGSDTYVLDFGDGHDSIDNFAFDKKLDTLLLNTTYNNIQVSRSCKNKKCDLDVYMNSHTNNDDTVCKATFLNWYNSPFHQHMLVRSSNGIGFMVDNEQNPRKIPLMIDGTKWTSKMDVDVNKYDFKSVKRIVGTKYDDNIIGNEHNNYIDPGKGVAALAGRNGSDTYMVKKDYGRIEIDNTAEDEKVDILSIDAHHEDIHSELSPLKTDIHIQSKEKDIDIHLMRYTNAPFAQHILVLSSDGIYYTLDNETEYSLKAVIINKAGECACQTIDLRSTTNLTSVMSVAGALKSVNNIDGNAMDNSMVGGELSDTFQGHSGNDVLNGGDGENFLDGGLGNDQLIGGKDRDWMLGDVGDDVFYPASGADRIDGGPGSDTLIFLGDPVNETGVFVDLFYGQGTGADADFDVYLNVENIYGSNYPDVLVGNDDNNTINGKGGGDIIKPMGGFDLLLGGEGEDIYMMEGATGVKTIYNHDLNLSSDIISMATTKVGDLLIANYSNDLILKVKSPCGTPPRKELLVLVVDYFLDDTNRHLLLRMNDTVLNYTSLESHAILLLDSTKLNSPACIPWLAIIIGVSAIGTVLTIAITIFACNM